MKRTLAQKVAARYMRSYVFESDEEMEKYLEEHPGADPSKHSVADKGEEGDGEGDEEPSGEMGSTKEIAKESKSLFAKIKGAFKKDSKEAKKAAKGISAETAKIADQALKEMKQPNRTLLTKKIPGLGNLKMVTVDEVKRTISMGKEFVKAIGDVNTAKSMQHLSEEFSDSAKNQIMAGFDKQIDKIQAKIDKLEGKEVKIEEEGGDVPDSLTFDIQSYKDDLKEATDRRDEFDKIDATMDDDHRKDILKKMTNESPPMASTKEGKNVATKYLAHYTQSTFASFVTGPMLGYGVGTGATAKAIVGAAGLSASSAFTIGGVAALGVGLAMGSVGYKMVSKLMAGRSEKKHEGYNRMVEAVVDGYENMDTVNDRFEAEVKKITDEGGSDEEVQKRIEEAKSKYNDELQAVAKGESVLRKMGAENQSMEDMIGDMAHGLSKEAIEEILDMMQNKPEDFLEMLVEEMGELAEDSDLEKKIEEQRELMVEAEKEASTKEASTRVASRYFDLQLQSSISRTLREVRSFRLDGK